MRRRHAVSLLIALVPVILPRSLRSALASSPLRGKLIEGPALRLTDGRVVALHGDEPTMLVLKDSRLSGSDFEVAGTMAQDLQFTVDPIHTRSLFAYKSGKRLMVTYWCDVCYIRTYSPGICVCCQKYTDLDLIDPATLEK